MIKKRPASRAPATARSPERAGAGSAGKTLGLAGAGLGHISDITREQTDIIAMAELRKKLDALMSDRKKQELTRPNAIALLETIRDGIGPSLEKPIDITGEGDVIYVDHPGVALLEDIVDSLLDLDDGKTNQALKRSSMGANASLPRKQRKQDRVWREAVLVIQRHFNTPTRKRAEDLLARKLTSAGVTRSGEEITASMLKSLRDHKKKY